MWQLRAPLKTPKLDSAWRSQVKGLFVEVVPNIGAKREQVEEQLLEAGMSLPLPHRSAWAETCAPADSWFVALRDKNWNSLFGFTVEVTQSRVMPGHLLMRVKKYGAAMTAAAASAGIDTLAEFSQCQRRVLRLYVEVFSRDQSIRKAIESSAALNGFQRVNPTSVYEKTLVVNLKPEESEIFASFDKSARRNIRAAGKKGMKICPISEQVYADRMNALQKETMERTGGQQIKQDWASIIKLSNKHPTLSRVVGCFLSDEAGLEQLVSFAWGCGHGDHATLERSASTRSIKSNTPLSYATTWDLIIWAKRNGCAWFDLGGVTQGSLGSSDALGGISDFKRYFSKQDANVGEEWIFEPHWLRGRLARSLSAATAFANSSYLKICMFFSGIS